MAIREESDMDALTERANTVVAGRTLAEWSRDVNVESFARHSDLLGHLKENHGLTHGYANTLALKLRGADAGSQTDDALLQAIFGGPKAALKPLYDALIEAVTAFGQDVEVSPKKAYVSLRRNKQFALLQPSTKDRLDVGLVLKGKAPIGRLEPAGSFNSMVTHRVRLGAEAGVDGEILDWLREAYSAS